MILQRDIRTPPCSQSGGYRVTGRRCAGSSGPPTTSSLRLGKATTTR